MTRKTTPEEGQDKKPLKKKGTRPGWRAANEMPKLKAKDGWTAKWASPNKLTRFKAEGWEIMKPEDNVGDEIISHDVNNARSIAGELRYMDMVAIKLSPEGKKERDAWLKNENKQAMSGILNDTDQGLAEMGVRTYAPKGSEGRIVIE